MEIIDVRDHSTQGGGLWRSNVSSPSSNDLLKVPDVQNEFNVVKGKNKGKCLPYFLVCPKLSVKTLFRIFV